MDTLTKVQGRWAVGKVCPTCVDKMSIRYGLDAALIRWSTYNEHYCECCKEFYRVSERGKIAKR